MALNTSETFRAARLSTLGAITAANVNRDGTGTLATLFTAGSDGAELVSILFSAQGDVPPDEIVRLFLNDGSTGFSHLATIRIGRLIVGAGSESDAPYLWVPPTGVLLVQGSYTVQGGSVQGTDFDTIAQGYSLTAVA